MPASEDDRPRRFLSSISSVPATANSSNSGQPEPSPAAQSDDDATGMDDPYLDELSVPDESLDLLTEDGPLAGVPIGLPMDPLDLDSAEEGKVGPESAELYSFDEGLRTLSDDDEPGPLEQGEWGRLDTPTSAEPDEPDDGPIENHALPLELLHPLGSDEGQDEEPLSAVPLSGLQFDDVELPWSKERWAECPLNAAFSPRQSLALVGTTLCAGGETTHLVHARQLTAIQDIPLNARTRRVLWLDAEASRLLLLTTTGQLYLWRRSDDSPGVTRQIKVPNAEVISLVWQLAPGVPTLLIRLESGRLLGWDDAAEALSPTVTPCDKQRLRALSEIGEPRISLWQDRGRSRVSMQFCADESPLALSLSMDRVLSDSHPLLAGFVDYVLLGVRDQGLFLRGPGAADFSLVPGCRRLTAFAVGLMHQRPTAFVGLFSELEDRAEVVALDLPTGRAHRVAELSVLTDDAGPADDPPERARIDALLWDPNLTRLWAAGCFGLTCFCPPAPNVSG